MGLQLSEVTNFWNSIYVLCVSALLPGMTTVRYHLTILPEKISWVVSSPGFPSCIVETVLSLGVELVVLILDSYLSYVGLYLAY